jgi:polyisoprenoid-binding protein YceI
MQSLSRLFMVSLIFIGAASAPAYASQKYSFDPAHTTVTWQANHFGFSNPSGKFPAVTGTLTLDEKTPANSKVDVTIQIAKLSTGDAQFDKHLLSKDFFNAEKFTTAKFFSTLIEMNGKDKAKIYGDLTLLGQTKPVVLDTVLNKLGENVFTKKQTAGFSATTILKRSDFGMNYAIPGVSDEVRIAIETEANLQDAGKAQ